MERVFFKVAERRFSLKKMLFERECSAFSHSAQPSPFFIREKRKK